MRVLCTFPGRNGDVIWQLPLLRAISRRIGQPVDLQIAGEFAPIAELLRLQPYLGMVRVDPDWPIEHRMPPTHHLDWGYDATIHLGYRGWPLPDLVRHTLETCGQQRWSVVAEVFENRPVTWEELDLSTPWITNLPAHSYRPPFVVGFSETHFELKYGLVELLQRKPHFYTARVLPPMVIGASNPRWEQEAGYAPTSWIESAQWIANAPVFLGCCSALHVLAVAIGTPVILMEPMESRHNPIFYPLGMAGPQVRMVLGNDGKPTHDARHVRDALREGIRG